jgi:hypothetical protein
MYEIIESKQWQCTDGRTASIYGSCPYVSDADKANWSMKTVGYTLLNLRTGTVGIGRKPFATFEEAAQFVLAH